MPALVTSPSPALGSWTRSLILLGSKLFFLFFYEMDCFCIALVFFNLLCFFFPFFSFPFSELPKERL